MLNWASGEKKKKNVNDFAHFWIIIVKIQFNGDKEVNKLSAVQKRLIASFSLLWFDFCRWQCRNT